MRAAPGDRETESYGYSERGGLDDAAALGDRLRRRLEHPHHAKSRLPVGHRRLALIDTRDEVSRFRAERFGDVDARRAHVAGAVVDQHAVLLGAVSGSVS